jgi:hypothetical protein
MSFLVHEFHDPLYFAHVQSAFGGGREEKIIFYPQVVWRGLKILLTSRPFDWRYFTYIQEFCAGVGGLLLLLISTKFVRASYVFFAFFAFFLPTTTGTFSSMPRYLLVCFPIFLFFTYFIQKSPLRMVLWLSLSIIFLVINTLLFIQGYWVA